MLAAAALFEAAADSSSPLEQLPAWRRCRRLALIFLMTPDLVADGTKPPFLNVVCCFHPLIPALAWTASGGIRSPEQDASPLLGFLDSNPQPATVQA